MGRLLGYAMTLGGQGVQVAFSASELADGVLPDITGVAIQMDGDGEYAPMKTTTASVSLLTDGVALMRIAAAGYPIRVTVDNIVTQTTLFKGYVVPNSYNQQLLGVNDTVTIECIDCLGYSKYVNYAQMDAELGFASLTLGDAVVRCLNLSGAAGRRERVMIPQSAYIWRGEPVMAIDGLILSEAYFFNSVLPDSVTEDYRPAAMTCEEVLNMIAESFRLTWVMVGEHVYLLDMLSPVGGIVTYRDLLTGETETLPKVHEITEESFAGTSCNISSLSRVVMTEVTHVRRESLSVLQNPFDKAACVKDGEYVEYYDATEDAYNRVISLPLRSKLYDVYSGDGCYSQFVAWCDNPSVVPSPETPHFLDNYAWGDGNWTVALKIYDPNGGAPLKELLRKKIQYSLPVVGEPRGLPKNAARTLNIAAEVCVAAADNSANRNRLWPKDEKSIDCKLLVSVIVNGQYYDPRVHDYVAEQVVFAVEVFKNGTAHWKIYDIHDKEEDGIPVPGHGTVELVIYNRGNVDTGWYVAWLKRLELTLRSDTYALREDLLQPDVVRVGKWDLNRVQKIEPPLSMHYMMNERPIGVPWNDSGVRASLVYTIDGEDMTFAEYAHALANVGDRLMYEMPLQDEANRISPIDAFKCAMWNGNKVVAGYARDVLNNTVNVTLI